MNRPFSDSQKEGLYRAIYERRDMRHFVSGTIAPPLFAKLLAAAHAAPSVGLMQPWRFIRISNRSIRSSLHEIVERERLETARAMGEREDEFMRLKVEGIESCAELLVVALMDRRESHIFGRRTMPEMDMASVSCAIQNLWLAARAEGLGLGWVSLFEPEEVRDLLSIPVDTKPVAILCLGPVENFYEEPMLKTEGWIKPGRLDDVLMENGWDADKAEQAHRRE